MFEANFMLPWNFSEEGAAENHMAQLQHSMQVAAPRTAVLSIITRRRGGNDHFRRPALPTPALLTEDAKEASGHGVQAKRSMSGAIS
ncbi:hypothetical protein CP49_22105 [Bradyrhizobium valentinum]|uniref:Uncharacterized protein n=1 Tax=Bradyrhizobium valentinum TaxID=1518501 RepID=A0A0R3LUD5_9BRAD|nr:hypothetical protein CP49_22105 [Bradyrhizobium valentinum]